MEVRQDCVISTQASTCTLYLMWQFCNLSVSDYFAIMVTTDGTVSGFPMSINYFTPLAAALEIFSSPAPPIHLTPNPHHTPHSCSTDSNFYSPGRI